MLPLPTPAELAAENPACYLNVKKCNTDTGCKRELYGSTCTVCNSTSDACETPPSDWTFPTLEKAVGENGGTGDASADSSSTKDSTSSGTSGKSSSSGAASLSKEVNHANVVESVRSPPRLLLLVGGHLGRRARHDPGADAVAALVRELVQDGFEARAREHEQTRDAQRHARGVARRAEQQRALAEVVERALVDLLLALRLVVDVGHGPRGGHERHQTLLALPRALGLLGVGARLPRLAQTQRRPHAHLDPLVDGDLGRAALIVPGGFVVVFILCWDGAVAVGLRVALSHRRDEHDAALDDVQAPLHVATLDDDIVADEELVLQRRDDGARRTPAAPKAAVLAAALARVCHDSHATRERSRPASAATYRSGTGGSAGSAPPEQPSPQAARQHAEDAHRNEDHRHRCLSLLGVHRQDVAVADRGDGTDAEVVANAVPESQHVRGG
ncbi:hypothetical protein ON010_g6877 [Phytophthora cinnamomi]|nr:hypothetical protein ON010_g6877 [Phytophthora cinnamomi]